MLRGRRCILAVIAGLILIAAAENQNKKMLGSQRQPSGQKSTTTTLPVKPSNNTGDTQAAHQQCIGKDGEKADCTAISVQAAIEQARDADWQANAAAAGVIIGFLTLLAAAAAACFAWLAAHHTKRSADAANEAQRPWIAIRKARICQDIDNSGAGAVPMMLIEIEFVVENVGSAPARDFGISYKFASEGDAVSVIDGLIVDFESALAISDDGKRLAGKVIFPVAKETIPGKFRFEVDPAMKTIDGGFVFSDPLLVGAFFYRDPHNKSTRYTTFAYKIGYAGGHWPVIPPQHPRPPFSKGKIHLAKWPSGWLAS